MSATWMLLNTAYLVYALSGTFRDMLRLRLILLVSTVLFMIYGAYAGIWSVLWWNVPVGAVHAYQVWLLLKQRRGIDLDDEADAIHTLLFDDLDRAAFNTMWHVGTERLATDEVLIEHGQPVDELLLILDGHVSVDVAKGATFPLGKLRLLGEMSHVSGGAASATVSAVGTVRLRCWDKVALAAVGRKHPEIERSLLRAIGQELANKLR